MSTGSRRTQFVFAATGTKGDLLPLLALGRAMVRRGHAVHLVANEGYAAAAAGHGLAFTGVTVDQADNTVSPHDNLNHHIFPSYAPSLEFFREQVSVNPDLVVVNLDEYSASNTIAEHFGLPVCRIHLAPNRIRSLIRPPWPFHEKFRGPMGATYRKHFLPLIYASWARVPSFMNALNRFRAGLSLRPLQTTDEVDHVVRQHLGFFPDWYAEPAADWPRPFELVGFPLPASSSSPPARLTEFIAREGKPLVFTPGTGVPDVRQFFDEARHCCEALGMPGVFLSPHLRTPSERPGSRIIHFDFVELSLVLQHAAALVHHGGIGTTARAFQAGVPQIIRPKLYDQPDNGDRVNRLGVGRCLLSDHYTNDKLIEAVASIRSSQEVDRALARIRRLVAASDAVELAANLLERRFVHERPAFTASKRAG
ncbi:MAG: nucleotide disphospho-sugar-binding domain-containing protein [Polyangiaceae bacterium]